MSGVIKGYNGAGFVVNGRVKIDNRINSEMRREIIEQKKSSNGQTSVNSVQNQPSSSESEQTTALQQAELMLQQREEMKRKELEQMKENMLSQARKQALDILKKAEEEAAWITEKANQEIEKAREEAEGIIAQAESEAKKAADEAIEKGFDEGHEKGLSEGYDQGYLNGLKKCKETLVELKRINGDILSKKSEMFKSYERQIFDTALEIAQKITINSLKQKDKAVIQKMIKEAAKEFRTAQNVKITLSSLDYSDETQVDYDRIKSLFLPDATVEIEILEEAEAGTLLIDNGSEILDAGVSTQLRMIEELGRGKYRDKPSEYDNSSSEAVPEEVAQAVPEEVAQAVLEEVAEAVPEEVAQATPEEVAEVAPEEVAEVAPEEVAQAVLEEVAQAVLEEVAQAVPEEVANTLPELTPTGEMPELMLIDDSGASVSADELQKKSEEQATMAAEAMKAELEKFEELEQEHAKEMEKEAKRASRSSRPRKPTNPLLGKMLDNLGD